MIYRFGAFEIDLKGYSLTRGGTPVHLLPKLFDVLVHLIEHRERVVTHRELLDAIWADEDAPSRAVHWALSRIRTALGQERGNPSPIATVPRRGYRFVGALQEVARRPDGSAPPPGSRDPGHGTDGFIGREDVLQLLNRAVDLARSGAGSLNLLIGELGIGKSRCALELSARLASEGIVCSAVCGHGGMAPPLWPWLQILLELRKETHLSLPLDRECEALLAALQRDSITAQGAASTALRRFTLLDRMRRVLLGASARSAHIIVLDDLHDADEMSLDLLTLLAPHLAASRLMILGTLREPARDSDGPAARRLFEIRARGRCIQLSPWSREEVGRFLSSAWPARDGLDLTEVLWQRSGGNPLFAEQLLRLWRVHATEAADSKAWPFPHQRMVPAFVQELVRERLEGVSGAVRSAICAASVIGRVFDLSLLQRVTGQSAEELLASVDGATRLGLIERGEKQSEYVFRHELIRDAIYTELSGADRTRLHGRTGDALEEPALGPVNTSVVAWHFYCAAAVGYATKAVRYADQAARKAQRMGAHSDKARYWEWALEAQAFCSDDTNPALRCELLIALGGARIDLGEQPAGRRHLARAIEIAEAQDLLPALAEAGFVLRRSMLVAGLPDVLALRALEEARRRLPDSDIVMRSRVASHLSGIPPYTEHPELSQQLAGEASDLAQRSGDAIAMLDALKARCRIAIASDQVEELLDSAIEIERLAERQDAAPAVLEGQLYRYLALLQLGRANEAHEVLKLSTCLAERSSAHETTRFVRHLAARREYLSGRLDEAVECYGALRPRQSRRGSELAEFRWLIGMALVHLDRGTCEELWPTFVDRTLLWRRRSSSLAGLSLRMLIAQGRRAEAKSELDMIPVTVLKQDARMQGSLGMLSHFALVASALRDTLRCRVLYDELLPHAGLHAVDLLWFSFGPVSHFLGVLASALEDARSARAHFEAAVQESSACGYRICAAWSRLGLARLLAEQGEAHSRGAQDRLLREVEHDAREMQLGGLIRAVESLQVRRTAAGPHRSG